MTLFLPDEAYRDNPQLSDVYRMPRYMQSPQAYKEELLRRRSQPPGTQVGLLGPKYSPMLGQPNYASLSPEAKQRVDLARQEEELRRAEQGPQLHEERLRGMQEAGQRHYEELLRRRPPPGMEVARLLEPAVIPPELGQELRRPRPQGPQVNPYTQAGQRPSMYPGQNVPPFSPYQQQPQQPFSPYQQPPQQPFNPYQQQPQQPFSPYGAGFNAGYRPPPFQPMQTPPPPPQQMGGKGGGMPSQGAFGQFAPQPMQPQPYQPMQTPPPPPQQMGGKGGGMPSQGGYTSSGMRPQPATPYQPMQTPPPPPQQMGGKGGGMPPQGGYNQTQEHPDVQAKPNSSPFRSAIGHQARAAMF